MLPQFELIEPVTLAEALAALAGPGEPPTPLAGGTNLLVDMRNRRAGPARLLRLDRLAELRGVAIADGRIRIGAATTVNELMGRREIAESAPALVQAARVFAGHTVRNAATVAGNVCYGSPAADLVPPLMALGARVVLASMAGERTLPLEEFLLGYRETARRADELLTAIAWPVHPPASASLFRKVGLRRGDAITVVGVAVMVALEGGRCASARIALGAVAPTVIRASAAEDAVIGRALTPAEAAEAGRRAAAACRPIDDLRASADYRRHTVEVLVRRLLTEAWTIAAGPGEPHPLAAGD